MKKILKVIIVSLISISAILTIFLAVTYREKLHLTDDLRNSTGHKYIELSEGFTEYDIGGDPSGTPVVLIHGMTVAMYDWDLQYEYLINNGFRVLKYNHYGRGLSDRPETVYDRKLYIKQLNEMISHFFDEKVNLIGHSLGGALAVEYAALYKDNIDKLILIAPVLYPGRDHGGVNLIRLPLIGDYCSLTILSPLLASRAEELFRSVPTDDIDKYNELFNLQTKIKGFSTSVKSLFRNDAMGDYSESYSKIDGTKSLLLIGDIDNSIPQEDLTRIQEINPEINVKIYKGVNHHINREIYKETNDQIIRFLSSNQSF